MSDLPPRRSPRSGPTNRRGRAGRLGTAGTMNTRNSRRWHNLANAGLALAVLLVCAPFGMRAYGEWSAGRAYRRASARLNAARHVQAQRAANTAPARRAFQPMLVDIPQRGIETVVEEGHSRETMRLGSGHEPGTAGAGGAGNCVVAGHRNMWGAPFANLDRVQPGDLIQVMDETGIHTYRAETSKEVSTSDRRYLADSKDALLTLYTCVEPFDADRRWVVQARLVTSS